MRKLMFLIVLFVFVGIPSVFAQTKTITGTVIGKDDGMPIIGVSVSVKGTTIGTITSSTGSYSLNVPADANTLVFSFVGMKTVEEAIGSRSLINITLESGDISVDEVVIVAYGTSTKKSFTGTVTQINADRIESKNVSNISQALAGEVAGVQVINSNGQPGKSTDIRIRGIGSINGSRDPLFVVDGVPLQGDINAISPSDIASTTVLKDASATAIYGARGANGVIIITTKTGKKGDSTIDVDLKHGVNMRLLPDYDVISSPEEFVETAWSALRTRGLLRGNSDPVKYANTYLFNSVSGSPGFSAYYNLWDAAGADLINPETGKFNSGVNRRYTPDSWEDALFQQNKRTEASVRISGGDEKNSYFTSFSFLDDQGYYLNSDFERFTGRLNLEHQARTWLKGSMNMSFMKSTSNFAGGQDEDSNNGFWLVANMPSIYPVYARDEDGNKIEDPILGGYVFDYGDGTYGKRRFASLTNAVASSTYDVVRQNNMQFSGNSKLEATFLRNFVLSSTFGLEYLNTAYDNLGNAFYGGSAEQGGSIYKVKNDYFAYTITNMLRYSQQFNNHSISAFIAQEASSYNRKRMTAFKSNLVDPWGLELNNAVVSTPSTSYSIDRMLVSYFGQVSYDFQEKYFLQGVVRRDGSSKFINDKWGTFGSIGAAWMVSSEEFMSSTSSILNALKLKASYGVIGEQGGIGEYKAHDLYEVGNLNDMISITFNNKGNPDLTWEESKQLQIGTEFQLFKRIDGSIDYYTKNTDNLLFNKRMAPSLGYAIVQVNDGAMINSGLEVDLNVNILKNKDFSLDFGINGAFEKNEITEMPIDDATGKPKVIDVDRIYGRSVGHSLFDIYTYEFVGVDPTNGASQWYQYYNELSDGTKEYIRDMELYMAENSGRIGTIGKEITTTYTNATKTYLDKSPIPTVRGSFDFKVRYKGLSMSALFGYSLGGYGYDYNYADLMGDDLVGSNNWHKDIANAWKNPGDVTDVPAISGGTAIPNGVDYSHANSTSSRFITSTNYLSLNNVVVSYDFDRQLVGRMGLKGVRLFVSGDNLWISTKRKGFYPNTSEVGASSRYQYVALTSLTGGINIKF